MIEIIEVTSKYGLSLVLSGIVVYLFIRVIQALPQLLSFFRHIVVTMENQNKIVESNSVYLVDSIEREKKVLEVAVSTKELILNLDEKVDMIPEVILEKLDENNLSNKEIQTIVRIETDKIVDEIKKFLRKDFEGIFNKDKN